MNKSIFKAAVSTATVLILLLLLLILLWMLNKEQAELRFCHSIVAQAVPYQPDTGIETEHKILFPASVFNSNFVVASNNMRNRVRQDKSGKDGAASAAEAVPCAAPAGTIPLQYTEVRYPNIEYPIYIFMDTNGSARYRIYVSKDTGGKAVSGYVQAQQAIANMKIRFDFDVNGDFVDPLSEPFGEIAPADAPEELAGSLVKEYGLVGTYYRVNDKGIKEYYVYGHYPNSEDEFYLADSSGHMIPGTLPVAIN